MSRVIDCWTARTAPSSSSESHNRSAAVSDSQPFRRSTPVCENFTTRFLSNCDAVSCRMMHMDQLLVHIEIPIPAIYGRVSTAIIAREWLLHQPMFLMAHQRVRSRYSRSDSLSISSWSSVRPSNFMGKNADFQSICIGLASCRPWRKEET
jgi:hypothetical protein